MSRPPTILVLALALSALAVAIAACGDGEGDEEDAVTVQETETVTADGENGPGAEDGEPLKPETIGPAHFQTPSGNIGCVFGGGQVRCDIAERDWSPPPPPPDCELDYGQGISLAAGGDAAFVCAGDTALGGPATLAYGSVAQRGRLRCTSERSGVTCIDIGDASGFVLSREAYRLL